MLLQACGGRGKARGGIKIILLLDCPGRTKSVIQGDSGFTCHAQCLNSNTLFWHPCCTLKSDVSQMDGLDEVKRGIPNPGSNADGWREILQTRKTSFGGQRMADQQARTICSITGNLWFAQEIYLCLEMLTTSLARLPDRSS